MATSFLFIQSQVYGFEKMLAFDRFFEYRVYAVRLVRGGFVVHPARYHDDGDLVALVAQLDE